MAILCFVLAIVSALVCAKLYDKNHHDLEEFDWKELVIFLTSGTVLVILAFSTFVFSIWGITGTIDSRYIDQKIQAYEEENAAIEKDIDYIVAQYMEHENKTFDMSKVESSTVLVQMYPELKSDELVSNQIDIYNSNNKKIKKLKLQKIKNQKAKFYLYFGG